MTVPDDSASQSAERAIHLLREATRHTPYEGRLYLVGGLLRDRFLGLPVPNDLDLVLEGDAIALAEFLYKKRLSTHAPVTYPRFGMAMLHIGREEGKEAEGRLFPTPMDAEGSMVELVTLKDDVFRRDFTINTLLENLHTGEQLDLTGRALEDLQAGIIRTPLEPRVTFFDDPLRMLRAIRFAARFDFHIEEATWAAIVAEAERLRPPVISYERIREEFVKIVRLPGPKVRRGLELLLTSRLLEQFLPEMLPMAGCPQNEWHLYDVWTHTLVAMEHLPDSARTELRLGLLWHDIGKPATRTEDEKGVHFYGHPQVGMETARAMMTRLKFSNDEIRDVTTLVRLHMRLGEYRPDWADAPVKRLIRDCGSYLDDLFVLARCDIAATNLSIGQAVDLDGLRARIDALNAISNVVQIESPLDGNEIMETLGIGPGPHLRAAKDFLTNEVIEGRLAEGDKEAARKQLRRWWKEHKGD